MSKRWHSFCNSRHRCRSLLSFRWFGSIHRYPITRFGFLNIDFSDGNPHTKLSGTFCDNKGDEVRDQFTIEKEIQVKKLVDKSYLIW
ncbi:MAG: hypothetical protein QOK58_10665 [Nitrososphaeraceae archaeon]|nr:hypothetical protein [Nitrososphaeraceae archaeon]MDW0176703.1 hypothetical protein [Nitrososphaeraceae archaeon]MDW0286233.1 hypothetical protein [Nitrososphaeraceae archaeon]